MFGIDDALAAGAGVVGSVINGIGANKNKKRELELRKRALDSADQNYGQRSPFRQAALDALNRPQVDAGQYFDPSAYNYSPLDTGEGAGAGMAAGAATAAANKAGTFDRTAYIRDQLANLDAESAPVFDAGARKVGQKAAALGRLGTGQIGTDLGELEARSRRERNTLETNLLATAAGDMANDQFRAADLQRGLASDAFGRDQALYGRRAGEADRKTSLGRAKLSDRLATLGANNAGAASRNSTLGTLSGIGYGNDPTGTYQWAAGQAGNDANASMDAAGAGAGNLGELLAYLRKKRTPSAGGGQTYDGGYPTQPE